MRRPKLWADLRRGQRGGWPVKPVGRFLVEETGGLRLVPTSNTPLGFVPAFDGNQVLYQQNNPAHGQPITLAALCYPTTNETVAVSWGVAGGPGRTQLKVQDSGGGYTHNFQLVDSGATLLEVTSGVNDSPLNIPWLMVGVSAHATDHKSYLNGRLVASSGSSLTLQTTCNQFGVGGRDNSGWGLKFVGSVAWAGVWDAALSFSEVQELWTLSLQYGYVPSATPSYYFITGIKEPPLSAVVSDSATVTDAVTRVLSPLHPAVSDTATVTDAVTTGGILYQTTSDASAVTDAVTTGGILYQTTSDTATITDEVTTSGTIFLVLSDTATITDEVTTDGILYQTTSDASTVTDAVTTSSDISLTVTEAVTVQDEATSGGTIFVPATIGYPLRPDSDIATGTWTAIPGSPFYGCVDETRPLADPTTEYVKSPYGASTLTLGLSNPAVTPPEGGEVVIYIQLWWAGGDL